MLKKGRTTFLKFAIILIGVVVLALCLFWLPQMANYFADVGPEFAYLKYPVLIGIYVTTVPFYMALYQALKLLKFIDTQEVFTSKSVGSLKRITYSALIIGLFYILGVLFLNTQGGALNPGIGLLGLMISFASFVVSIFSAVLQELLGNMIKIKTENEFTI